MAVPAVDDAIMLLCRKMIGTGAPNAAGAAEQARMPTTEASEDVFYL